MTNAGTNGAASNLKTLLQQAEALRQSAQAEAALALLEQAVGLYPASAEAHQAHSLLLVDLRRYAEAAISARTLVALQQKSPQAHNILAYILLCMGEYAQAVSSYDRVLAMQPKSADIHGDRAVALLQLKRFDEALKSLDKAIMLQPKNAIFYSNRGNVFKEMGRLDEALKNYDRALALAPDYADAHSNRAMILNRLKRFDEALTSAKRAVALQPTSIEALNNQGTAFRGLDRLNEALASYDRALTLQPQFAGALSNRGVALLQLKRYEEAVKSLNAALALQPDMGETHGHLGLALHGLERETEALASYDRAIALQPDLLVVHESRSQLLLKFKRYRDVLPGTERILADDPDHMHAHHMLGSAHFHLGNYETAIAHYDHMIARDDALPEIHNDRGVAHIGMQNHDAAIADYDRAIALKPDYADAYWNKSLCYLLFGEFEVGLKLYEWRWKTELFTPVARSFPQPLWLGQIPIAGKTILIYPEQGFGDFIQCARYVPVLEAMGARVLLETYGAFQILMRSLSPTVTLLMRDDVKPPFDVHCPIMSLPLALGTTVDTIPHPTPYLSPNPLKQALWKATLGAKTLPRVGLVWSGSSAHGNDYNRSLPLDQLAPLLALPLEFHSLQKEFRAGDEAILAQYPSLRTHADKLQDFADTAALIDAMDVVITVDTSVAHLAGALGKPVWLLLPYAPDYRWMLGREDSPWYSSMRLFRQSKTGDWPSVLDRVIEGLKTTLLS